MTREELIEHLEHLEKYTHYSEDAPALREAIEMLKCSEMPNSSDERTETHACDLPQSTMGQVNDTVQSTNDCISRQAAIDIVVFECDKWTGLAKEISKQLRQLPPVQPDHIVEVGKKVGDDLISRQGVSAWLYNLGYTKLADIVMNEQRFPSAQSEQRWIPVSERLPDHTENNDYYLVTIQCEHYDGWDDYVTGFAEWTKYGWDELSCYIGQIKVIAWMPLPEPYKERREDG